MKVRQLTLRNFRNIEEATLVADPHLNFILGSNGQGKTSFIEALGFLATLRSFRGGKTEEVVRWGSTHAEISCTVTPELSPGPDRASHPQIQSGYVDNSPAKQDLDTQPSSPNPFENFSPTSETFLPTENLSTYPQSYPQNAEGSSLANEESKWKTELKVAFQVASAMAFHKGRTAKVAFINGKPFRSSTQYLSQRFGQFELGFHTVVFNPSDHDLVRSEPAGRRSYLDRVLAAEDLDYLQTLQKYQRVLEQRNALLKTVDNPSKGLLAGFSEPLAAYGSNITLKRLEWLKKLSIRVPEVARQIAPRQPVLMPLYQSSWVPQIKNLSCPNKNLDSVHFAGQEHLPSLEILEQAFWKQLNLLEEAELRSRSSLVGPHRDDWTFLLGGQILKGHGSQGEVRSALLALKLCEIELFREKTSHRPLLLLDDFSSELDRERRSFLLKFLADTDLQVFVTTTEDTVYSGKRLWISNGKLSTSSPSG